MLLMLASALLAVPAPSPDMATSDATSDRCRVRLAAKLGTLGTFAPGHNSHRGRTTIVTGVVDRLDQPAPAAPGMMAPTHVLVTRYAFRCEVRSGIVRRLALYPKSD